MKFSAVIGQDELKQRLIKTVKDNRISHAQLFLGPEGSGKLALAIAYAQYINCTDKKDDDSCGLCPSCIKYEKLVHPDLHFIYPTASTKQFDKPTSNDFVKSWRELVVERKSYFTLLDWYEMIGIERKQAIINQRDCNNIIKILGYKTYEARYKVMIIWMVDKLFHAAAPKILKILEEPPENTLFILVSENQDKILPTILSRTQLVKILPLEKEILIKKLIDEGIEPNIANDTIRVAGGNYLMAKSYISQSEDDEFNFITFKKWMRLCFSYKVSDIIDFVNTFSKNSREQQKGFLNYALRMVRECLLINTSNNQLVRLNSNEMAFMEKFHPFINLKNGPQIASEINNSIYYIERNVNSSLMFLDLSLKLGKSMKS